MVFGNVGHSNRNKAIQKWVHDSGVLKHITFHCFRHTYATLLIANNVDIYVVRDMLGHKNVKVTQKYAKVMDMAKINAAGAIPSLS